VLTESKRFIREAVQAGKPFFVWHNTTRMHYRTNLSKEYEGKSGTGSVYHDGMMKLDDDVGELLNLLDETQHAADHPSRSRSVRALPRSARFRRSRSLPLAGSVGGAGSRLVRTSR
jgi:hypothetical protein